MVLKMENLKKAFAVSDDDRAAKGKKATTLRSVARLSRPDSRDIPFSGKMLFSRGRGSGSEAPTSLSGPGIMSQSYAIWPHLSVLNNVASPLHVMPRRNRPNKKVIEERVTRMLATEELDSFAGRPATKLSGGQQHRRERARVSEPPLLLLDEPLSNRDVKLRKSLRLELKRLQNEIGVTSIYVTLYQVEALALSSRIVVISQARVGQVGPRRDIYARPQTKFIGESTFMEATPAEARLDTAYGPREGAHEGALTVVDRYVLGVRPESIELALASTATKTNGFTGTVVARSFLGEAIDHVVDIGGFEPKARVNPFVSFEPGTKVALIIDPTALSLIPGGVQ